MNHSWHANSIAIIGMAGRFPKAENIYQYWNNIENAVESVTFLSEEELLQTGITANQFNHPNYVKAASFLENADCFDADFFGYTPREAASMAPSHRLFLEIAWKALEDAGYGNSFQGECIGVFGGDGPVVSSYMISEPGIHNNLAGMTGSIEHVGNDKDYLCTKVSYRLNLKGPGLTIQTACSTSLVAVHMACQSLLNSECDMALAGGVNIRIPQKTGYMINDSPLFSPDGHCRPFDAEANGTIFGSAVGIVLLKPLETAIKDNDHIYAVIRGSAINNDGASKMSYWASSADGLSDTVSEALALAQIDPKTVGYVEAHGTGTALGDPVEIIALSRVFRQYSSEKQFCALGSVKSNIGHTDAASGIAGLIKTVMMLKHRILPPTLNVSTPNPKCNFPDSPFFVNNTSMEWIKDKTNRRAIVNSMGIGGTNASVVLEEYVDENIVSEKCIDNSSDIESTDPKIIVLSAKNKERLQDYAKILLDYCSGNSQDISLIDMAYTLQIGRESMDERLAMVVSDMDELIEKLFQFTQKTKNQTGIYTGNSKQHDKKRDLLVSGEEGKIFINAILQAKNVSKIAQLWVSGIDIDWQLLYDTPPKRIALPTYPFEKKRYWIAPPISPQINIRHNNQKESSHQSTLYFVENWKQSENNKIDHYDHSSLLIFANEKSIVSLFEKQFNASVIAIYPGETFKIIAPNSYQIQPDSAADFEQLVHLIKAFPKTIVHAWSQESFDSDPKWIETHLNQSLHALFHLIKSLGQHKHDSFNLIYAYQISKNDSNPVYESIRAFACAVREEHANIAVKTIGLDSFSNLSWVIEKECHAPEADIRYVDQTRYIRYMEETNCPQMSTLPIKENGVYLITGGVGVLGLIIAQFLSTQKNVRLIICGRKKQPQSPQLESIQEIQANGSTVEYFQADIAIQQDVTSLIEKIMAAYQTIDGIFHCAGVIRPGYIYNKPSTDMLEVLSSKVFGTIYLDDATKDIGLDFFVMYSSVSSIMANMGLSDYAYANSFLDHFARRRQQLEAAKKRSGKTISINWPMWAESGMNYSDSTQNILQFLKDTIGIIPIETHQATNILACLLSNSMNQLVVIPGLRGKIQYYIEKSCLDNLQIEKPISSEPVNMSEMIEKTNYDLKQMIFDILGIEINLMDNDDNIENFGFDSITFTSFATAINDFYNLNITPALFYGTQTIAELSLLLIENNPQIFQALYAPKNAEQKTSETKIIPQFLPPKPIVTRHYSTENAPVAIIGMSAIFPQSENISTFWEHIIAGHDLISEVPEDRWDSRIYPIKWGGFIPDVDKFDPQFFGISPKEAEFMDPQQRLC
ncbi:MAG: hypothetical protein OMM_08741, partial [Candidatus Magnetoglobus multicellularis str. Araruama]